jgi:UPF0755 protein
LRPRRQDGRRQTAGRDWCSILTTRLSADATTAPPSRPKTRKASALDDTRYTRYPSAKRRRKIRRRRAALIVVIILVLLVLVAGGAALNLFRVGPQGNAVTVVIPSGSSLSTVAEILAQHHVIPHPLAFELRARFDGRGSQFKAGTYRLHVNEPFATLAATLVKGSKPQTVKITIPEGFTIAQAARIVHAKIPAFSAAKYVHLAEHYPGTVDVAGYKKGATLQGLLFPATYDVLPTVRPRQFIEKQLAALHANLAEVDMTRAAAAHLTPYDVVIIASLIEGEAHAAQDRAKVAAVIWNRLHVGMRLQIDATVLYALGRHKKLVTYADLRVDSPYNTYQHAGLTPTPIDNPGLAAMTAAADPVHASYLYYVGRSDGTGPLYFSATYGQFLKDKARVQQ